jgi:hypothetical protein
MVTSLETESSNKPYTDRISFDGKFFSGTAWVFEPDGITLREINFTVRQPNILTPFKYNKPIENPADPSASPIKYIEDVVPRENVYPIAFVKSAKRPPNHLHEVDDAILSAVYIEDKNEWQTRYFPKKSLDESVWQEAMELLNHVER